MSTCTNIYTDNGEQQLCILPDSEPGNRGIAMVLLPPILATRGNIESVFKHLSEKMMQSSPRAATWSEIANLMDFRCEVQLFIFTKLASSNCYGMYSIA